MRASEMRKGQTVKVDGKLYAIVDYQHVKLGKGGAVYQTKLKSLTDGSIQNIRLRAEEIVEEAYLDKRTYEYLYSSGSEHVLIHRGLGVGEDRGAHRVESADHGYPLRGHLLSLLGGRALPDPERARRAPADRRRERHRAIHQELSGLERATQVGKRLGLGAEGHG